MPKPLPLIVLSAALLLGGCTTTMPPIVNTVATAPLVAADGTARGMAMLVATDGKLELRVMAQDLPAGVHGMHLHAVGTCTPPDFTSAGPHLNPHGKMHGTDNPLGSHVGDLPNLTAGADGKAALSVPFRDSQALLDQQMFDSDGTALVIHAGPDDYKTDPTGNSGARIACGAFMRR